MVIKYAGAQMTPAQRQLAEVERQLAFHQLGLYKPYPKQIAFHHAAAIRGVRERLLIAGNQVGKTWCAAMEVAMHLTGVYPKWWLGAKYRKPTVIWAGSVTSQGTRDTVQRLLLGPPGQPSLQGTGSIPKACLIPDGVKKATHGVSDAVETIMVRHVPTGGVSRVTLKSYDQGRLRWQGDTINFVWFDEEPDEEIYNEGLTRTNATGGLAIMTFTPLLGMSSVVKKFLVEKRLGTHVTTMTMDDAPHFTAEDKVTIAASYPEHERKARVFGIPMMGQGSVFPIDEDTLKEQTVAIPPHWARIVGVDFGYDHPTAAAWLAWDRDQDIVHVYDVYKQRLGTPVIHSAAIRARGAWIPCAWPHDGLQHDKGSGVILADQYRALGVNMLKQRATHAPSPGQKEGDGGNGVEAGLMDMLDRMQTGRLRIARHLNDWFEEMRMYHRKDGKVVRDNDDVISATRYALMMLRRAKPVEAPKRAVVQAFRPMDSGMGMLG